MNDRDMIMKQDAFLDMVKQYNLTPIKVAPDIKLSVQMICKEEEFLKLASIKSSVVFYFFEYPEDYEVLITGDTFDMADNEIQEMIKYLGISEDFLWDLDRAVYPDIEDDTVLDEPYELTSLETNIKNEVLSYNAQANRASLKTPRRFMAFYIDCGCLVGVYKNMEDQGRSTAEEKLFSILSVYKAQIEQNKEFDEANKNAVREKLKAFLKKDAQFKISTNKALRREYAITIWDNKDFEWIKAGFGKGYGGYPSEDFMLFVERVYNEIKYFRTSSTVYQKNNTD